MADFIHGHVARHIFARGVDYFSEAPASADMDVLDTIPQDIIKQIPTWGAVLLISTAFVFILIMGSVRYTLGRVVTTLAMVETPTTVARIEISEDDFSNEKKPERLETVEVTTVKQVPLTSSIRNTLRHLHKRGGFRARWRGLAAGLVYTFALQTLTHTLFILGRPVAAILSTITLASLATTWTHIVISDPSPKPWFRRVPAGRVSWIKVLPATAVFAIVSQVAMYLPVGVAYSLGLFEAVNNPEYFHDMTRCAAAHIAGKVLAVFAAGVFTFFHLYIPARVTLTRVQASLLPEEDEPIVPFDRSFGGRVIPQSEGGSGVVGLKDAWKTFDWPSRFRLLKLYVKMGAIAVALYALMLQVLFSEAYFIMGDKLFDLMRALAR